VPAPTSLATDRLLLRPIEPADADDFAAMNADPAVMEHFTTGPMDRASSDRLLARMQADQLRDGWGQGYATEAATAWLRHAFDDLALPRLISITIPANERSIAVMRRLGFALWERTTHDDLDVVVYARDAG